MTTLQPSRVDEVALTESRSLRAQYVTRVDVLEKVKALSLLPDGVHATTEGVATYYEVPIETIRKAVQRNRDELTGNGLRIVRGAELRDILSSGSFDPRVSSLTLFTRRTILNVGELLTGSQVAQEVRRYLLDVEDTATAEHRADVVAAMPNHVEALRGWADALERAERAEATVSVLAPKAEAFDEGMSREGLMTLTDFAKKFGHPPRRIFPHLVATGWIFKNQREEYRAHVAHEHLFEVRDTTRTYSDGVAVQQLYLNPHGEEELRVWLKANPVPGSKRKPSTDLMLPLSRGA